MHKYTCVFCDKKLKVANYKARKTHNNGTKHRMMLRTHYLEVLEDEEIRKELEGLRMLNDIHKIVDVHKEEESIKEKEFMRINEKQTKFCKFIMPPMTIPKDFRFPPPPQGFHLPPGFDFEDEQNFDPDLNKASSKIK